MRKRPSYWPTDRSLFRNTDRRRSAAVWIVLAAAIAAAVLMATLWPRQPIV
ncbi:MAG TPA: hypothetical protein VF169_09240 [Albitalea sp.]|uniref:hypothetical protein n=1 Tax=Piscinibacter sp. TaxID=1903157 RepID=UPI002ED593BF